MVESDRSRRNGNGSKFLRFALTAVASYGATRFFADFLHLRLYVTHQRIHLHHFLLGLVLTPLTWIAFENDRKTEAELLAGAVTGLFLSEIKQLILEQWGP
ncbi:MAG TPA: hypothetical protein VLV31_12830 [Candidatus Acidoferrales bacterium]|nr:hypothetical protein [Candidatus Acidoferrales bacterium]